ncbi:MAG: hypothetical protein LBU60_04545 [Clostridiales bacterium]|nr:hypothetical protein [Clostridiales bacterium]
MRISKKSKTFWGVVCIVELVVFLTTYLFLIYIQNVLHRETGGTGHLMGWIPLYLLIVFFTADAIVFYFMKKYDALVVSKYGFSAFKLLVAGVLLVVAMVLYNDPFIKALGTKNIRQIDSLSNMPHQPIKIVYSYGVKEYGREGVTMEDSNEIVVVMEFVELLVYSKYGEDREVSANGFLELYSDSSKPWSISLDSEYDRASKTTYYLTNGAGLIAYLNALVKES